MARLLTTATEFVSGFVTEVFWATILDSQFANCEYLLPSGKRTLMKQHKGMRPHDIAVLLKIIARKENQWLNKDLAAELFISPSEITESLGRSAIAGLIDPSKKKVFSNSFLDFLLHGLKYVFPVVPGSLVKGVATAQSAPVMSKYFSSAEKYVWPDANGKERGMRIDPLYPGTVKAAANDRSLYDLLALCDVIRVGKVREIKKAEELLIKLLNK